MSNLRSPERDINPSGHLSRRQFLKSSGFLTTIALLEACAPPPLKPSNIIATLAPEPTGKPPTETNGNVSLPVEIPNQFEGQLINKNYLLNEINIPVYNPTPVPPTDNTSQQTETSNEYAKKHFALNSLDTSNALDVLKYTLAQVPRLGINGGVTWSQPGSNGEKTAFAGLSYYREQVEIIKPETQNVLNMENAFPKKLLLKNGSGITIIGRGEDGDIAIAFEEYESRGEADFSEPRIRLAVLTPDELQILSDYKYLSHLSYKSGAENFTFTDLNGTQRTVTLNTIGEDIMDLIYKEAGEGWYEQMPVKIENGVVTEYKPFPNPVIPKLDPKRDVLPDGFDWENAKLNIVNLEPDSKNFNYLHPEDPTSAVVFAVDENTNTVLTSRYDGKEWKWKVPGLRDYADALSFKIATLMDGTAEFWENTKWMDVASREFNTGAITPLWHGVFEKQGEANFQFPDLQLEYAENGDMDIHVESLVALGWNPTWVTEGNFTDEELKTIYENFCRTVVKRYRGKVDSWSAVIETGIIYGQGADFWYDHLGLEYIDIACQIIREEDPDSKVIIGDFGNYTLDGFKYKQTKEIVDRLLPKTLIDGVGLEIDLNPPNNIPSKEELINTMRSYGIPVYITELNVDIRELGGTDTERYQRQAEIYRLVVEAALESGVCKQIIFWGFGDKYSFAEQPEFGGSDKADSTIFDDELEPKLAYAADVDALKSKVFS